MRRHIVSIFVPSLRWERSEFPNTESLILAQNERWRRGLGMQVERGWGQLQPSGERVSNAWETCPRDGDNTSNEVLIPNETTGPHGPEVKGWPLLASYRLRMVPRPIS